MVFPQRSCKHAHTQTCTLMFMAALFITAQTWKQPGCPSVGEQIMEHCSVLSHSVNLLDCNLPRSSVYGIFQVRILEWSGLPFPPPGDLPDPGIEPMSPALQVDSLPAEPQEKHKNTEVGSLSLCQCIFPTQELNQECSL